jgi:hypothetical protein
LQEEEKSSVDQLYSELEGDTGLAVLEIIKDIRVMMAPAPRESRL